MLGNVRLLIGPLSRPVRTANQHRRNLTQNERHQPSGVEAEWTDNQVQKTSLSGQADTGRLYQLLFASVSTSTTRIQINTHSHAISSSLTNTTNTTNTITKMTVKATTCCRQGTDAECACGEFRHSSSDSSNDILTINLANSPESHLFMRRAVCSSLHLRQGHH